MREGGRGTIWDWRCWRPGLRGLITVRFRPPMAQAALRGHWIRWMATLTRRFVHRLTSGPATPTGILFDTRLSRPFPRPLRTGEDRGGSHSRGVLWNMSQGLPSESSISDCRKALRAPGVRYHRKATHAGQHENWLRPGLRTAASRYERSIGGRGWLVANWVKGCGINAKKS